MKEENLNTEETKTANDTSKSMVELLVMPLLIKDNILGRLIDRLNQLEKQLNSGYGMINKQKIRIRTKELKKIIDLVQSA